MMATAVAAGLAGCQAAFDPETVPDATRAEVTRVEPLSWWTGMKTPLQLMVQGEGIGTKEIRMEGGKGVSVRNLHKAENPDYLFVDVEIDANAKPGEYYLVVSDGTNEVKYPYLIREREKGSADRKSFTPADMIYLIMPDRFASSGPGNDEAWPGGIYDDGSAVPWVVPVTPDRVDRDDPVARHGGDIQGIIDHLDYVADLGATALWSTPLLLDNQPRESYHGYACGDYYHIDPRFGDNALYRKMVDEAHGKGLKVIMDIVTNHCGTAHWWMDNPPFADWYHVTKPYMQMNALFSVYMDPHASVKDRERQQSGWFVPSMPDMNLDNPYVLRYFQQWAVWWIEYAGLDGLRVDTYPYNEPEPMAEWCKAVRREYPGMNIVGECWDMNIPQLAYWQAGNPNPNGFDSNLPCIMDFPLQRAILSALCEDQVWWDEGMTRVYSVLAQDFAYKDLSNLMIFFANHDHARTGDVLRHDPSRMKLALALLATLRGIPQLYYGDEMMFCERPGFNHDGSKRIDFPGGWEGDAVDLFSEDGRAAAGRTPEADYTSAAGLHDYARALFTWRRAAPVIHHGRTLHFLSRKNVDAVNYTDNTYAYFRYDDTDAVFVYINNTDEDRALDWSHYDEFVSGPVNGRDVISGEQVTLSDGLVVEPRSALIVEFKR
ncbi:MAG: cyclomaltodextrinase N-terminal domain-containing protein [Bacteroidales bacterium]|nr:cyclomaltodextrinase N-terminal domain-containing protein [Bacteroidales bacterium]